MSCIDTSINAYANKSIRFHSQVCLSFFLLLFPPEPQSALFIFHRCICVCVSISVLFFRLELEIVVVYSSVLLLWLARSCAQHILRAVINYCHIKTNQQKNNDLKWARWRNWMGHGKPSNKSMTGMENKTAEKTTAERQVLQCAQFTLQCKVTRKQSN